MFYLVGVLNNSVQKDKLSQLLKEPPKTLTFYIFRRNFVEEVELMD